MFLTRNTTLFRALSLLVVFSLLLTACGSVSGEGAINLDLGGGEGSGGEGGGGAISQNTLLILIIVLLVVVALGGVLR
ncbi:MAG: hypothetical protein DWG76_02460 [Chloroflexi bacterium]|nr:hypothetical protein [Chloroflexota bacterium]